MAKALVIKGANFASNKVTTVTLDDIVPCTGITLSDSTFVATAIGATKTLTATVTPSDTTEQIVWASSDTNVATVSNGVITIVGVGTANITASCGSQVATCTVTATVTVNISSVPYRNGFGYTSTDLSAGKDFSNKDAHTANRAYFDTTNPLNGFVVVSTNETAYDDVFPFALPQNASHFVMKNIDDSVWGIRSLICLNANENRTYSSLPSSTNRAQSCRAYTNNIWASSGTVEGDIPSGANAYAFYLRRKNAADASVVGAATGTIVFS